MPTVNKKYFKNKEEKRQELEIRRLFEEGKETYEIADAVGATIYDVRKALGLE